MDFKSLSMLSSKPEAKEEVLEGEHDLNFHNMLSFKEHSDKLLYPTLYNLSDNTVVEYMGGGLNVSDVATGGHVHLNGTGGGGLNVPGVATGGYVDTGALTTGGHLSGAGGTGGLNVPRVATGGYVDTGGLKTGGHLGRAGGFMNVSDVANDGYVDTSGHASAGTGMLNAYGVTTGGYVESGIGRPPNNPHRSDTMRNHSIDSWIDELDPFYMPIIQGNFSLLTISQCTYLPINSYLDLMSPILPVMQSTGSTSSYHLKKLSTSRHI